jgi:putative polyketide hydroxylase
MIDVPVLIVGGGPVGLTMSLILSQQGAKSILVERHPGTAVVPKARAINARTMEMYRQLGVESDIRAAGLPPQFGKSIIWTETLAGKEIKRLTPGRSSAESLAVSPTGNCGCSQDLLEPVLRAHAERLAPESVLFNTELKSFTMTDDAVEGELLERSTGKIVPFRAQYLVAADGAHSPVRHMLGIERTGERDIYDSVNIHSRVDLRPWTAGRPAALYYVDQPDLRGTFLTINGTDRWGFLIHSLSVYGFTQANMPPERCVEMIRRAVGVVDLPVEVLGISFWKCSAMVSDKFKSGRVFLVGDAAHETTPSGGFGLNLGVQDAHNLAWKLAAVLRGEAGISLLETYEVERQPVAREIVRATLLNMQSLGRTERQAEAKLPRAQYLNEQGLIFGLQYQSSAVVPDGSTPSEVADHVTQYVPTAFPGSRAPHVWLKRGNDRVSTIELYGRTFVMMIGPEGREWRNAVPLHLWKSVEIHQIGVDLSDDADDFCAAYGIEKGGAVLIRPDGYVAFRSNFLAENPGAILSDAFGQLLGL